MVHRVNLTSNTIRGIYFERGTVTNMEQLLELISTLIDRGLRPGTVNETMKNHRKFHISFDDGYKEQLEVVQTLKEQFSIRKSHMTVAINVGNSLFKMHSGMDPIYLAMEYGIESDILPLFGIISNGTINSRIEQFKQISMQMPPGWHKKLHGTISHLPQNLSSLFLTSQNILELDKIATIASHGITHRDLRYHLEQSQKEIDESKHILEGLLNHEISIFCYPEGKSNNQIHQYCRDSGYTFGLSIRNIQKNNYCVGRYCVNRHYEDLMGSLYE